MPRIDERSEFMRRLLDEVSAMPTSWGFGKPRLRYRRGEWICSDGFYHGAGPNKELAYLHWHLANVKGLRIKYPEPPSSKVIDDFMDAIRMWG